MERVEIAVIGAGVVGLAVGHRLASAGRRVLVLERNDAPGQETSSRNSEVIHAGLYYPEDLLKTRLCVRGRPMLYDVLAREGLPHRRTGKVILATNPDEEAALHRVKDQAERNGVPGVELISRSRIGALEPNVFGTLGLYSPESGIFDARRFMAWLEHGIREHGGSVACGRSVETLSRDGDLYTVCVRETAAETSSEADREIRAERVINAAGLDAHRLAATAGIDLDRAGYRIYYCKGEYFSVSHRHTGKISRLIYPAPGGVSLGAHAGLALDGSFKIGPGADYVDEIDYGVDPAHRAAFFAGARRFLPFLRLEDLAPVVAGIRPKRYRSGEPVADFIIRDEADRGLPGLIDLIGIESPGLTACLAIAEAVEALVR